MTIQFPENPQNGDTFQPKPNPNNLVFEFDDGTNSWTIVGPDNIATIDYVDDQLSDSTSDVVRNYHLHTSVNSVSITANYQYYYSDTNTGNPYDSEGDINQDTHCDFIFSSGVEGGVQIDNLSVEEAVAIEIEDWHKCMEAHMGAGQFKAVGVDYNGYTLSYKFKNIKGFNFHLKDKENNDVSWIEEANIGDVIEVNYETGSAGSPKYAIYKILAIYELQNFATPSYGVSVDFMESATPDEAFASNPTNTYYEFRNYLQPLNSGGGKLSGDLKIVSDSTEALSVWRNEDTITQENPHNLLFKVDTTNNKLLSSKQYDRALRNDTHLDDELLVTLNHFNTRLGFPTDYSTGDNGPFVKRSGDTMTGTLTLERGVTNGSGAKTFIIKGKNTSGTEEKMFYAFKDISGDSVRYVGVIKDINDIVNKKFVDTSISNLSKEIEGKNYLKKNSSADSNKMTSSLNFGSQKGINLSCGDSANNSDAASVGYVKARMSGKIHNGVLKDEGQLYTTGGCLYFNTYK